MAQHAHDILVRKHYRKPAWALGTREFPDISQGLVEYVPIEEYERIQRLILRGRRYPALHCQMFSKARTSALPMPAGCRTPWKRMK